MIEPEVPYVENMRRVLASDPSMEVYLAQLAQEAEIEDAVLATIKVMAQPYTYTSLGAVARSNLLDMSIARCVRALHLASKFIDMLDAWCRLGHQGQ